MTLAQMAEHLGITAATLRQQVARGVLHAEKSGRDWFVTEEEAARYECDYAGKPGAASPRHPKQGLGGSDGLHQRDHCERTGTVHMPFPPDRRNHV